MRRHAITALFTMVVVIVAPVYGAEPKKSRHWDPIIKKALATGEEQLLHEKFARLIGLGEMACQHFEVPSSSTTDGVNHRFHLLVDESTGPVVLTPRTIVLDREEQSGTTTDSYYFRLDLGGDLLAVARLVGRLDETGKAVKGSGVVTHPPLDSPEVRQLLQHELDFWLKNAYRKPQPKKKRAR